jgi:putative addiction module antidote
MPTLKIRRVGNSLGVIFPREIQEALNISEGDIIDVSTIEKNKVVLEAHLPHHSKWKFKNAELTDEDKKWLESDLEDEDDYAHR